MITLALLKLHVKYDPITGFFTALQPTQRRDVGDRLDCEHASNGYVYVFVLGKTYGAGRLAWFYMTGEWPEFEVDHEDRRKNNNAWYNLRHLTHADNCKNRVFEVRTSSGVAGVTLHKKTGKWRAEYAGTYLGLYVTVDLASQRINIQKDQS